MNSQKGLIFIAYYQVRLLILIELSFQLVKGAAGQASDAWILSSSISFS